MASNISRLTGTKGASYDVFIRDQGDSNNIGTYEVMFLHVDLHVGDLEEVVGKRNLAPARSRQDFESWH